jgi:hypothetical protein
MNKKKMIYTGGMLLGLLLIGSVVEWRGSRAGAAYSTPVTVMNTTASPANVLGTETAARAPYELTVGQLCQASGNCVFPFPGPGAGHRLVIQNASGILAVQTASTILPNITMIVTNMNGGQFETFFGLPPGPIVPFTGNYNVVNFNQSLVAYVDPGGNATFYIDAQHASGLSSVTLSGYVQDCSLVPCPALLNN